LSVSLVANDDGGERGRGEVRERNQSRDHHEVRA
jgi:hypothetical protein